MITLKYGESVYDKASPEDLDRAIDDVMKRLGTAKLPTRAEFLAWKKQRREDGIEIGSE